MVLGSQRTHARHHHPVHCCCFSNACILNPARQSLGRDAGQLVQSQPTMGHANRHWFTTRTVFYCWLSKTNITPMLVMPHRLLCPCVTRRGKNSRHDSLCDNLCVLVASKQACPHKMPTGQQCSTPHHQPTITAPPHHQLPNTLHSCRCTRASAMTCEPLEHSNVCVWEAPTLLPCWRTVWHTTTQ